MQISVGIKSILKIAWRECGILKSNPIYLFCMIVFPLLVTFFFTSLMNDGQPQEMPVGVVDMDNSTTSRALIRKLDAFQTTKVVGYYSNVNEARNAIQRNDIYAFLYIPESTTDKLLSSRQPKISFYYSYTSLTAGALLFRDLKTIATLGSAGVGSAAMSAKGYTNRQISTFLQPIAIDLHPISNPWISYNVYLSTMLVPGCLMIFLFLITAYSLGTELKFDRSKKWMRLAGNNPIVALMGKMLPQFVVFLTIFYAYLFYVFGVLGFPHPGGIGVILLLGFLSVIAAQGFGIFAFGIMPSLRMSMSICSLWAVLSFSMVGSAFPVASMDSELQALSNLFPLRHYFMIYQTCIFNDYPLADAWINVVVLLAFALLPILVLGRIKKAMLEYIYIP